MINKKSKLAQQFYETGRACPIYDFHGHMHEFASGYLPRHSSAKMIGLMNRANVKLMVFCSHNALFLTGYELEKNRDETKLFPEKLRAYHGIISRLTNFEDFFANMENNPDVYVGAKFLCDYNTTPLSSEAHKPFFQYLNEHSMLVLLHTWGGSPYNGPAEVERAAKNYPGITFVCGHSFHGEWGAGAALAKKYPNLYYELTATHDDYGVIEFLTANVSSERILFGTDLPWFSTYVGIGSVLAADISDDDRENIFFRNAWRLSEKHAWIKEFM